MVQIKRVDAKDIVPLRARILRPEGPVHEVLFVEDLMPESIHLAAYCPEGNLVGCVSALPSEHDGKPAMWLRAMAIDTLHQGTGIGHSLLLEVEKRIKACKGKFLHIWCNARLSRKEFYTRHGFIETQDSTFKNGKAGESIKLIRRCL